MNFFSSRQYYTSNIFLQQTCSTNHFYIPLIVNVCSPKYHNKSQQNQSAIMNPSSVATSFSLSELWVHLLPIASLFEDGSREIWMWMSLLDAIIINLIIYQYGFQNFSSVFSSLKSYVHFGIAMESRSTISVSRTIRYQCSQSTIALALADPSRPLPSVSRIQTKKRTSFFVEASDPR